MFYMLINYVIFIMSQLLIYREKTWNVFIPFGGKKILFYSVSSFSSSSFSFFKTYMWISVLYFIFYNAFVYPLKLLVCAAVNLHI